MTPRHPVRMNPRHIMTVSPTHLLHINGVLISRTRSDSSLFLQCICTTMLHIGSLLLHMAPKDLILPRKILCILSIQRPSASSESQLGMGACPVLVSMLEISIGGELCQSVDMTLMAGSCCCTVMIDSGFSFSDMELFLF